jgi:GT2 family glycosyltransferase/glycosyltransferase involved in cell wall biosynthesis
MERRFMPETNKHKHALELVNANQLDEACRVLEEALQENENGELWNDWATAKIALGQINEARTGFERAQELAPDDAQIQFNLGLLLVNEGSVRRGLELLEKSAPRLGQQEQAAVDSLRELHRNSIGSQPDEVSTEAGSGDGKRILIIHEVLPHFDRSGSDMRIMQVVKGLRAQEHRVTFIGRYAWNQEVYQPALEKLGVKAFCGDAERLPALGLDIEPKWKLEEVLNKGQFDIAILFHWFWNGLSVTEQYLNDIRRLSPKTKVVVLTDDRHGVREWRRAELSGLSVDRERALDYLGREVECYRSADMVLAITEDDRQGILEMVPELQIELLPMTAEVHPNRAGFDDRHNFIFLADFNNPASKDAAVWFCKEVWQRIRRRLPKAKLQLAGNGNSAEFAEEPQVELLGRVASIEDTLGHCRVFVSPIRYGTGIKTKNLNALGNGIPLITTTIGAEGMSLTDHENALIADNAGAFANKAVELYNNRELWEKLAANGPAHIEAAFSVAHLDAQIKKIIARLENIEPKAHDPEHHFSICLVEEFYPEVLTALPQERRHDVRILGHLQLAEKLAGMGHPAEALEQARHIFSCLRGTVSRSLFLARILSLLERCYRETGDLETARRCGDEAKLCLPELNPSFVKEVDKERTSRVKPSDRAISVIIPTFNRQVTLERCLQALASQTLSSDEFEVIVVDDGSTDDTQQFLRKCQTPYRLSYFQQKNQGAGAARKSAVEHARGEYLLLINDDTIADSGLLQEHLAIQRAHHDSCFAVLGTFDYERAARRRALTYFLSTDPFMFPQKNMHPEWYYGYTHFVTCNLSVRRDAVLAAGSFDPAFRLGEDTEMGLRMARNGCKVIYDPNARALHDHLDINMKNMVGRAMAYGPIYLRLLEKHPTLELTHPGFELKNPITLADIERIRETLEKRRAQIEETVKALAQYDDRDFELFFATRSGNGTAAEMIANLFRQAIPQVHWFYVFEGLCASWSEKHAVVTNEQAVAEARA